MAVQVTSSGSIATARIFGSGLYEVVAKVPQASGMIWAIWTYHYEPRLPKSVPYAISLIDHVPMLICPSCRD
jgi:beta-glucanase (GH16 family)